MTKQSMLKTFHAAVSFFNMLPWFPGNWQPQSLLWYWEYLGDSYSNCESLANSFYKYSLYLKGILYYSWGLQKENSCSPWLDNKICY